MSVAHWKGEQEWGWSDPKFIFGVLSKTSDLNEGRSGAGCKEYAGLSCPGSEQNLLNDYLNYGSTEQFKKVPGMRQQISFNDMITTSS